MVLSLWGVTKLAGPSLSDALDEDGALQAESADDTIELTVEGETLDAELTFEETEQLQFMLGLAGLLDLEVDVDGDIGPKTLDAIDEAIELWELDEPSIRAVFEHAQERFADHPVFNL